MIFPKKLKIGPHDIKIVFAKDNNLGEGDCGKSDKTKGEIIISHELIETEKIATLFHEIFHYLNGELSETVVEPLSQQLTQVLLDNKMLR